MARFYLRSFIILLFTIGYSITTNAQVYQFAKSIGSTNTDIGYSVAVDASGNIYTTGAFQGTVDFDPGTGSFNLTANGSFDVFLTKLDKQGNFVWAKQWGGSVDDRGYALAIDAGGNIYVTGYFKGQSDMDPGAGKVNFTAVGADDIFISKLNPAGDLIWTKQIGGTDVDRAKSIAVDAAGNVVTTGYFIGTCDFDPGATTGNLVSSANTSDIFILKLNVTGDYVWAKRFGVASLDEGHSITVDAAGNIYTTGEYGGTVDFDPGTGTTNLNCIGVYDIFVLKLDASGALVWAKSMGGEGYETGNAIAVDASGNVFTTGLFEDVCDFDPSAAQFNLTTAGGIGTIDNDIYISKLTSAGNFSWAKRIGALNDDISYALKIDAYGNVYAAGAFHDLVDFDPSAATANLAASGLSDIFILKLNNGGAYLWAKQIGAGAEEMAFGIAVDGAENVYTTGQFQGGGVDFDPGTGVAALNSNGDYDAFLVKLGKYKAGIETGNNSNSISVAPNPVNHFTNIYLGEANTNATIIVADILGNTIYSLENINEANARLDLSNLPAGMYLLKVISEGSQSSLKLLKN